MKQEEKHSRSDIMKAIRRTIASAHKNKDDHVYLFFFLNMIAAGVLPVIATFIPRTIIDDLTNGLEIGLLLRHVGVLVGISLILGVVAAVANLFVNGEFIDIRMQEFDRVSVKYEHIDYWHLEDPSFRDRLEVGTMALQSNNIGFESIFHRFMRIFPFVLSIVLYSVLIGLFKPIIFVACVIGAFITFFINKAIANYALKKRDELSNKRRHKQYFYQTASDFSFGKDIRVYDLNQKISSDYKQAIYSYISVVKNISNRRFSLGLLELIMLVIQDGLAYFFIIQGYYQNSITLGDVSLYVGLVIALSTTLRLLSSELAELVKDAGYTADYYHFIDDETLYGKRGSREAIVADHPFAIEFSHLTFNYPRSEMNIFSDFSLKIKAGEKVAIVGINGAGKSTLIKLLTGLFTPSKGKIFIDGIDSEEFKEDEYQKMFAPVYQEVNIYAGTVIENITGPNPSEKNRAWAIECLKRVGLEKKIESLPQKYDTPLLKIVDDGGVELSGGQSQKLAIARGLYKDANIVILDEPTSALDALAEASIYQSFDDLVKNKTAIYISHRLSSTKFCDRIILLGPEGIIEDGSHDQLMAKKGEYYQMFKTQGKYYQMKQKEELAHE